MTQCYPRKQSRTIARPWLQSGNCVTIKKDPPQIECRPLLYRTVDICWPCFSISTMVRRHCSSVDVGAVIQRRNQEDGRYKSEHDTSNTPRPRSPFSSTSHAQHASPRERQGRLPHLSIIPLLLETRNLLLDLIQRSLQLLLHLVHFVLSSHEICKLRFDIVLLFFGFLRAHLKISQGFRVQIIRTTYLLGSFITRHASRQIIVGLLLEAMQH